jgi:hypothetical protein
MAIKEEELQLKEQLQLLLNDQQPSRKRREQRGEQRKKSQTPCTNSYK